MSLASPMIPSDDVHPQTKLLAAVAADAHRADLSVAIDGNPVAFTPPKIQEYCTEPTMRGS